MSQPDGVSCEILLIGGFYHSRSPRNSNNVAACAAEHCELLTALNGSMAPAVANWFTALMTESEKKSPRRWDMGFGFVMLCARNGVLEGGFVWVLERARERRESRPLAI
uniref:Uncharacterized protein n=1 Tax=Plectus sambesii TaxID=2011161 RepID=A0A914WRG4_9BILA